jgi:hypothetical protein
VILTKIESVSILHDEESFLKAYNILKVTGKKISDCPFRTAALVFSTEGKVK